MTLLSILTQMSDDDENTEEVQAAAEDFMDLDEKIFEQQTTNNKQQTINNDCGSSVWRILSTGRSEGDERRELYECGRG